MDAVSLSPLLLATAEPAAAVPHYQTWICAAILVITLVVLASERIHKTVLALLAGGVCLLLGDLWGYFPHDAGHHLPPYIAMIEWEVIGIVIGATVFVEIAARSGIFTFLSIRMLKASGGDPFRLLVLFSILTAVFSAFLDNITAMIIIGSLTIVACRKLALDAKPFLITEGIMTNVGGLLTLISSLPNIIVGQAAGISYLDFVIVAGPYTVLATVVTLIVARFCFGKAVAPLRDPAERRHNRELALAFDEWETVGSKRFFYTSIVAVVVVILAFALRPQIPILRDFGIEVVAMGAAVIMLLLHAHDVEEDLSHVQWSLVFFFIGLFTLIGVLERAGVLHYIGVALEKLTTYTGHVGLMWFTAAFSSVTDNIPLAAMLARIFGPTPEAAQAVAPVQWWAIVFGANLGGNITPIGSASTVVAVTILKKNGLRITFLEFVRLGAIFAAAQLLLGSGYLLILRAIL
ncbi:MAG: SLC13 family permease [Phycisphaerae bacterium]|jgi:Na+/H+ antiporter NhaD/arsenite permease-like protein